MTKEQAEKKKWLQRESREIKKLHAMQSSDSFSEQECLAEEEKIQKIHLEIKKAIAELCDPELEALLIHRYLDQETFEKIAEREKMDERTVYRKHLKALDQIKIV